MKTIQLLLILSFSLFLLPVTMNAFIGGSATTIHHTIPKTKKERRTLRKQLKQEFRQLKRIQKSNSNVVFNVIWISLLAILLIGSPIALLIIGIKKSLLALIILGGILGLIVLFLLYALIVILFSHRRKPIPMPAPTPPKTEQ